MDQFTNAVVDTHKEEICCVHFLDSTVQTKIILSEVICKMMKVIFRRIFISV